MNDEQPQLEGYSEAFMTAVLNVVSVGNHGVSRVSCLHMRASSIRVKVKWALMAI